jgi:tRNA pseudouridine13 synthase
VQAPEIAPDELHPGRNKVTLRFSLPRGAYATMLIKRLFAPSWYSQPIAADDERRPRAPSVGPRGRLDADFGSDEE